MHEDLPLPLRILRDELARGVERVLVDSRAEHARMLEFAQSFIPGAARRIELYAGPRPIFDLHGIEEEIGLALEQKVLLKSGGHLMIDQTEAMTTIDVNTGGYVGHRNLEETIYRTNLEAAVRDRAAAAAAQPGRHHHHRLHRHERRGASPCRCWRRSSARSRAIAPRRRW